MSRMIDSVYLIESIGTTIKTNFAEVRSKTFSYVMTRMWHCSETAQVHSGYGFYVKTHQVWDQYVRDRFWDRF